MVVGLTGGIGSGKTTVSNYFAKFENVLIYNADLEAKKLMNTSPLIKTQLIKEFGVEAFLDNQLNRPFISKIVFKDKEKLKSLNAIVHPAVKKHFQEFVNHRKKHQYIIYENAILFESGSDAKCDIIISVFSPLDLRIERTVLRDKSSEKEVNNRIKNQWLEDKKLLQSNYVIFNIKKEDTQNQTVRIHNILTKKLG